MGDLTTSNQSCGDCNRTDPEWGSLNRGILLCNDCCFVHRSLGPQYSKIKSLAEKWHPSLRKMVMTLASGSANHVWEHSLLDPSIKHDKDSVKKPGPNDTLETKKKFIHSKHFQYQFVLRNNGDSLEVRSQELHSTVRTAALDTTLRLLACGADPNYFHPEKGTRPLHVAAINGQSLQVELLFLHGAHTDAPDYLGQTPVEHAMAAGFKELAQRIIELRFELTDRISYFACGEIPDHVGSKHILLPCLKNKNAKQETSVSNLPPNVLEQLASDLYDEVERRHVEKVIATRLGANSNKFSIAFLPVNPHYPSVRNQTRQKFARLTNDELASLISLVLSECKRRHCTGPSDIDVEKDIFVNRESIIMEPPPPIPTSTVPLKPTEDDDYPLYDSVASDEDLVLAEQQVILAQQRATLEESTSIRRSSVKPVSACDLNAFKDNLLLTKLMDAENKIQELQEDNHSLKKEVSTLQKMIRSIIRDNLELKLVGNPRTDESSSVQNLVNGHGSDESLQSSKPKPPTRPSSMCEPKSRRSDEFSSPERALSREMYVRRGKLLGMTSLVQETTRRIVGLIKVLIEYAISTDTQGLKLTSSAVYDEVQAMSAALVSMRESSASKDISDSLEKVVYQALRMKSEIPILCDSPDIKSSTTQPTFVQKVKHLCFDVGAAMKRLMSAVDSPQ